MRTVVDVIGLRMQPNHFDPQEEGSDVLQSLGISTCWNTRFRNPEEQSLNINCSDIAAATVLVIIIIVIGIITLLSICLLENFIYPRLSVGLGSTRGREFILSPEDKGRVLGICILYGTFVIVLLFAPVLICFWLNVYSIDILESF